MALIRNSIAATLARDAIVLDLGDLREQADQILRAARMQADRIVTEAQAERERILAGAVEQGRADGMAKGVEAGRAAGQSEGMAQALTEHRQRLTQIEGAWTTALSEFCQRREELAQIAMRDVVRLGISIGERVTKRVIKLEPQVVADQLAAVLAVVARPTELVLRINPTDRLVVEQAMPGLVAAMPAVRHVEIAEDDSIEIGGCVVRTRAEIESGDAGGGEIDARVGTQLDRLVETLLPGAAPDKDVRA
jgi:flagellar assembly protein FliH